ncbi:Putative cardiolipin synthase [Colletotrichum destructivum]|uniref:Cardiolipin synthase n=1 Tax=Colletotrichum destructivum TaxID=34406 RepID=A0AAX4IUB8_9PEZI|nr:Putative cardiolipin synthase [Colletotrichum destructivum]
MTQNALVTNFLLQLCFAMLAVAAPASDPTVAATAYGNTWQYGTGGGILGFVVLVLDIIVFIEVLKSDRPVSHKVLWCLVVFLFPIVGMVIYWLFSNRAAHNSRAGYESIA